MYGTIEVLLPVVALVVLACGHLVLLRSVVIMPPGVAWAWAALGTGALLLLAEFAVAALSGDSIAHLWRHTPPNAAAYLSFAYAYFHAFNLSETGRRIRILLELQQHNCLSEAELLARYNAREVLDRRLERLLRAGQAELRGDYLVARGRSVAMMALIITALKWLVTGRSHVSAEMPRNTLERNPTPIAADDRMR